MMMNIVVEENQDEASAALSDLKRRKRELKERLQSFDVQFYRQHGRVPAKKDKEPVRHLYENYKSIKNQISAREEEIRSGRVDITLSSDIFPTGTPPNDLAALKAEKNTLYLILRSYEEEFFKKNHRKVSSLNDTQPCESHYKRYVAVKKALASIEDPQKEEQEEVL